jgi:hypothetical protein
VQPTVAASNSIQCALFYTLLHLESIILNFGREMLKHGMHCCVRSSNYPYCIQPFEIHVHSTANPLICLLAFVVFTIAIVLKTFTACILAAAIWKVLYAFRLEL